MKARYLVVAALMMGTVSCGYSIKSTTATTDYDTKVDFSNYNTFFVIKGNSSGNPTVDDQLISSVQNVLTDKGWLVVPEGEGRAAVGRPHRNEDESHVPDFLRGLGRLALGGARERARLRRGLSGWNGGGDHLRR